jgi:hypothetical protein
MPVEPENLDREAVTLLYAAGELEPGQREAFERRLAAEPQLAAELEQFRAAQASVSAELKRADAHTRLPASEGVVVRRVSRSIQVWLDEQVAEPPPPVKKGLPLPWWSYPSAVAASLIVGFLVWSSRQEVPALEASPEAKRELSMMEAEQEELANWMATSLNATAYAALDAEAEYLLSPPGAVADDLNAVYRHEENAQ